MEERIRIRTLDGQYLIVGGDFRHILAVVRNIKGRRFRPEEKLWELPYRIEEVQKVVEAVGFHVTADDEVGRPLQAATRPRRETTNRVLIRTAEGPRVLVGGDFEAAVATVKSLPGRKWQPQERAWEVPGSLADIERVVAAQGFQLVSPEEAPPPTAEPSPRRRDQVRVRTRDGEHWVVGGTFDAMLQAVKGIDGRRFLAEEKIWELPCSLVEARSILGAAGYELADASSSSVVPKPPDSQTEE